MQLEMRPAWRNYWLSLGLCGLFGINFVVSPGTEYGTQWGMFWLTALFFGVAAAKRYSSLYTVKGGKIQAHAGIISRHQNSVRVQHLRNVNLRQSVVQRLLDVGDVQFSTSGGGGIEVVFAGVTSPAELRDRFEDEIDSTGSAAAQSSPGTT